MEKHTALITGASSGIGYELAKLFAADGHRLILVAHHEDGLRRVTTQLLSQYSVSIKAIAIDLAQADAAENLFAQTQAESITFLVNNAGFGNFDQFANIDLLADRQLLQLNITTLTELSKLYLPHMLQQNRGYILNVASTAAFQAGPYMSTYAASKAYVLSFTQALAFELRYTPIRITCLCPGPTATDFHRRAKIQNSPLFHERVMMSAAKVAQCGYRGMLRGKRIVIPGFSNKLLAFSTRLAPRRLSTSIAGWLNQQRESV